MDVCDSYLWVLCLILPLSYKICCISVKFKDYTDYSKQMHHSSTPELITFIIRTTTS